MDNNKIIEDSKFPNLSEKDLHVDEELELFMQSIEEEQSKINKTSYLIDEINNDNQHIRLYCIKNLINIAELLEFQRTEDELIPLIHNIIINKEDNEEILIEISKQIYKIYLLFDQKITFNQIKTLELLANNDDEDVRNTASEQLCLIIKNMNEEGINIEIFPLMQRLIQNDNNSKISCCYLFPIVYPKLTNEKTKQELLQAYYEFTKEDSPSVRRATTINLGAFADIASREDNCEVLMLDLIPLQLSLIKDSVDIVKVHAVETLKNTIKALDIIIHRTNLDNETKDKYLTSKTKLVKEFIDGIDKEKSWRVRHISGEVLCEISNYFSKEFNQDNFIPLVKSLLKDTAAEVRASILSKLDILIKNLPQECFIDVIFPILNDSILVDPNYHVRSILASNIITMIKHFNSNNNQDKIETKILPILKKVLKEETYEVTTNALNKIEEISYVYLLENPNENLITEVNQLLLNISKDPKWRIRYSLSSKLRNIYELIGEEKFNKNFNEILALMYKDNACKIREEALECILYIVMNRCGYDYKKNKEYVIEKIFSIVKECSESKSYILRIFSINSICKIINCLQDNSNNSNSVNIDSKLYKEKLINDILFSFDNEKIPNVKFNLAKCFKQIAINNSNKDILERTDYNKMKEILNSYINNKEEDQDVIYFSQQAIEQLNKVL